MEEQASERGQKRNCKQDVAVKTDRKKVLLKRLELRSFIPKAGLRGGLRESVPVWREISS